MPTERFYRLPEGKRQMIYEAAKQEFARVPYEEASINQIVRNAKISRGSFYTYFENKEDAMQYVMRESYQQIRSVCEDTLDRNGGEYIGMLRTLFEYLIEKMQSTKEIIAIVENVFGVGQMPGEAVDGQELNEDRTWMLDKMNYTRGHAGSQEEFRSMIILGADVLYSAVRQYYMHPEKLMDIRRMFEGKLNIISNGAYRMQAAT